MSLQELLDIAMRHLTSMADAMVSACLTKACATGEHVELRARAPGASPRGERPEERVDWQALVEGNTDTRLQHV